MTYTNPNVAFGRTTTGQTVPLAVDSEGRLLISGSLGSISGGSSLYTYTPSSPLSAAVGNYSTDFDFVTLKKVTAFNPGATFSIGDATNPTYYTGLLSFPSDINDTLTVTINPAPLDTPVILYLNPNGASLGEFLVVLHNIS